MSKSIPLFKIHSSPNDLKAIKKVIDRRGYWSSGPEIEIFEKQIADYVGSKYALVFNSGTSALHSMFLALEIGQEDEVIVPSFSFIATANAVLFVGAKPVFADIEDKTFGLDINDVKRKVTKNTKAIMVMHYGGCPSLYTKELEKLARENNLFFLEDAAESFGAKIGRKAIGTFGQAGIFSFCQNKIITTGEGGAIVTDSRSLHQKLQLIRSHGRLEKENYFSSTKKSEYITLGYNFRMSSFSAALGIAQLKKANKIIKMRKSLALEYRNELSNLNSVIMLAIPKGFSSVYQLFTILVQKTKRDKLKKYLIGKDIQVKVYFNPIHLTSFYKKKFGYKKGYLPLTESISRRAITIPLYPLLAKEQRKYIISQIVTFFK